MYFFRRTALWGVALVVLATAGIILWLTARHSRLVDRTYRIGWEVDPPEQLRGADATTNAKALRDVLEGTNSPFREVALLNAAAALIVAGKAETLKEGLQIAIHSVDSGEAEVRLDRLIAVSNDG